MKVTVSLNTHLAQTVKVVGLYDIACLT